MEFCELLLSGTLWRKLAGSTSGFNEWKGYVTHTHFNMYNSSS